MPDPEVITMREHLGRGVRRLRSGATQADLAAGMRRLGHSWTQPTVANVETGRREISSDELPSVCAALGATVVDLYGGQHGPDEAARAAAPLVKINDQVGFAPGDLVAALAGEGGLATLAYSAGGAWPGTIIGMPRPPDEVETALGRRIGATPAQVAAAADRLYRRSAWEERESRIAEGAVEDQSARSLQATRGHVSRTIAAELRHAIDGPAT